MLTLPELDIRKPKSFAEAAALLAQAGGKAMPLAGGTDLVPNLKHRLHEAVELVDLKSITEGREVELEGPTYRVGTLCTLDELAAHPGLRQKLPALAEACGLVAGPQLRRMGTLGGNVCLDTRCVYYNQTYFWRSALGFCLKKDGTVCHVVASGKKCVAAASNDTAPVLLALGARLVVVSPAGERELPLDDFYVADGIKNTRLSPGELVRAVLIDAPAPGTRMAYQKLRTRKAIDYPLLSLALVLRLDDAGRVAGLRVVLNALAARPRAINGLDALAVGKEPNRELVERVAEQVFRQTHPLTNILSDTEWRREMAPVLLRRAFARALTGSPGQAAASAGQASTVR
jgi:4-hydroxybenzoyl-CoA reductase subunit beta